MVYIKDIFKILLVIQLLSITLAFYGHPDAETIDFGTEPSREQLIIDAAIQRGMDGDAVAELLRTKQPVVKTVTSPTGLTKTTTYKLNDDGSISSNTITERKTSHTYTSGAIPDSIPIDNLRNSPSGTVTRTFTDENGHKVTQTISLTQPKPSTVLDTDDLTGDWFNKPFPNWSQQPATSSVHRTSTRTFTGPNDEKHFVQSWSSNPDFNEPEPSSQVPPSTNYHRTVTRTYTGPNGEKRVTQTTSTDPDDSDFPAPKNPKYPSVGPDNWPGFDFSTLSQNWGSTDTDLEDADEWTVVKGNPDVETSTKRIIQSWTPKAWNLPEFRGFTITTAKPKIFVEPELTNRKPLPNLDDFLSTQYGPITTSKTQTSTTVKAATNPNIPNNIPKSVITSTTKKPIHINLEDLPVTEILHNGKPANKTILKNLPPHLRPTTVNPENTRILKIEHKHPIEDAVEVGVFSPKVETNVRTFSKKHTGPEKPTITDLDPQMQDILKKAGISPDDITNIDGDTITKTRKEPDGRIITTTYKVKTVPSVSHTSNRDTSPVVPQFTSPSHTSHQVTPAVPKVTSHTYTPYKPLNNPMMPPLTPLKPLTPPKMSPISEFLAKLGLTPFDITSQHGQLTKTFIDEDGQILTATFVLSSPISNRSVPAPKEKPLK